MPLGRSGEGVYAMSRVFRMLGPQSSAEAGHGFRRDSVFARLLAFTFVAMMREIGRRPTIGQPPVSQCARLAGSEAGPSGPGGVMMRKRWQDWINLVLGLWTFVSPWVFGFAAGTNPVAQAMWVLGAAIVVFAAFAVYMHKAWEEVINILLGIYLFASPFVLSFTENQAPATNAMVVGLLVTAFAVWAMLKETAVQKWWHEHYPTR